MHSRLIFSCTVFGTKSSRGRGDARVVVVGRNFSSFHRIAYHTVCLPTSWLSQNVTESNAWLPQSFIEVPFGGMAVTGVISLFVTLFLLSQWITVIQLRST